VNRVVSRLIERHFRVSAGALCVGDVALPNLADTHGTPQFVYARAVAEYKLARLREALPACFDISYSVKANPNRAFLGFFLAAGCGLEIASAGEYVRARAAGCPPERIIFAGPGKTESELRHVLTGGIGEIHVESLREAERIDRIASSLRRQVPVAVRVNPTSEAEGGAMRMGGRAVPFGVDEEQLDGVVTRLQALRGLDLCGVHMFAGTQILDHTVLSAQYRKGLAIARHLAGLVGRPLATVDFGGGLGIPYFPSESELDVKALADELVLLTNEVAGDAAFANTRFMLEPGRFLVGEAGIYVARVTDIKVSRGKKFLILDGGMNHHLAASGNLGQVIKRNFPLAIINRLDETARETVDVVGPLCTPLDTLARDIDLPPAEVGDLVGIFQSGAYARSASPLGFLSHPGPPELWIEDGRVELVTPREPLGAGA
jgi:diaminopimelate decarboxylase